MLTLPEKWLLVVIGSENYVEGKTRLHKYGLLIYKKVPDITEFYQDWTPNNYGVFSPSLAKGLQTLQMQEYVIADQFISTSGRSVNRYKITEKGRNEIKELLEKQQEQVRKISEIIHHYFTKSLNVVLNDVYSLFPEFTTKSKIIPDVNKFKLEQEEFFEQELDDSIGEKLESNLTNLVTRETTEYVYNDEDIREKLAKKIGLRTIPKLDSSAFDKLSGLLANKIKSKEIDSVDAVRTVRGS